MAPNILITCIIISLVIAFFITIVILNANTKKIIDANIKLVDKQSSLLETNQSQVKKIKEQKSVLEDQKIALEKQQNALNEQKDLIDSLKKQQEELAEQLRQSTIDDMTLLKVQVQGCREQIEQTADMTDEQLFAWVDGQMDETRLFTEPTLNTKTMAKQLGLTQRRLNALFKNNEKYASLGDYLNEKRLLLACRLLHEEPNWTIEAVGTEAGFGSRRTFQTEMKRRLGVTPIQYRHGASTQGQKDQTSTRLNTQA